MARPVVVGLGPVPASAVDAVFGDVARFVPEPGPDDLAIAAGVIARADAVVDDEFLDRAPRLIDHCGELRDRRDVAARAPYFASWKITPRVMRLPAVSALTPWRMTTR